jgi:lysozyme
MHYAIDLIKQHEGLRLHLYRDSRGIPTIGWGRNLQAHGISYHEAELLLQADYAEALAAAMKYPWFGGLSQPRQAVVLDMIFNLGADGFGAFQVTIELIAAGDYAGAAAAMEHSKWAVQVGKRAEQDAEIMRTNEWPS